MKDNGIASASEWRTAGRAAHEARAELLRLPSGAMILAAKPEPLEWVMSGRIPQRLLSAALESSGSISPASASEISREEIVELARFAAQLVKASVVRPPIGEGPDAISLDDIPIEDRAFIFEWACRALSRPAPGPTGELTGPGELQAATSSIQEDLSSHKLERFRAK